MRTIKPLLVSFSFLVVFSLHAQQGIPLYLDYLLGNDALIHPSTVGVAYSGRFKATLRGQWFGLDKAPLLQTANANIRIKGMQGLGVMVFNDRNGFHSQVGGQISYAYHINLVRQSDQLNMLSFGISAGLYQRTLDETQFRSNYFDPLITGGQQVFSLTKNIDAGISYHYFESYAHFTAKNIFVSGQTIYQNQSFANTRRYILTLGRVIGKGIFFYDVSTSVLLSELEKERLLDVNFRAFYDSKKDRRKVRYRIWGGFSYRANIGGDFGQQVSFLSGLFGADYKDFTFGYIYSKPLVINLTGGLHQVMFGFRFLKKNEPYKCKCPSLF